MVQVKVWPTYVAESLIPNAGKGLFAAEFIPAGSHLGEYGGEKLQGGRKDALKLRREKKDGWVKRLGSIMHGDYLDSRVTPKFSISYYCKHGLIGGLINSKGADNTPSVNVKEVEYDQYFCHPYDQSLGVVTCRTFYVTTIDRTCTLARR